MSAVRAEYKYKDVEDTKNRCDNSKGTEKRAGHGIHYAAKTQFGGSRGKGYFK